MLPGTSAILKSSRVLSAAMLECDELGLTVRSGRRKDEEVSDCDCARQSSVRCQHDGQDSSGTAKRTRCQRLALPTLELLAVRLFCASAARPLPSHNITLLQYGTEKQQRQGQGAREGRCSKSQRRLVVYAMAAPSSVLTYSPFSPEY